MGPIPPAPQPRYISQVRPGPDLCTPLPSTRHTEVVDRDRGGREIYICDVAAWAHATNWSVVPAHQLPAHLANWPIVPVELLPFLAARPKPEAPRASPSSSPSDPPRPGPAPPRRPPPANWRPSPSAHRAALPRPIAPVAQGGPRHHRRRPTPRGQWAGACIRWVVTWAPVGTERLDRRGHPAKGPCHQSPRALRTPATHRIRITGRHPSGPGPWGPGRLYTDSPTTFG